MADVSDAAVEVGVAVGGGTEAATPAGAASTVGVSVLGTDSDELGGLTSMVSNPLTGTEENPKDSYNSLSLRSRDFNSAKALIVPDALKHAMASMVSLLVTDWSARIEVATKRLIFPHGRAAAAAGLPENKNNFVDSNLTAIVSKFLFVCN